MTLQIDATVMPKLQTAMMTAHPTVDFCSNDPAKATTQFGCIRPKTNTEGDRMDECISHE